MEASNFSIVSEDSIDVYQIKHSLNPNFVGPRSCYPLHVSLVEHKDFFRRSRAQRFHTYFLKPTLQNCSFLCFVNITVELNAKIWTDHVLQALPALKSV
jgi:hypothetical protein